MGHSEGAIVAATFVVEHLRRVSEGTVPDMLKCAVFMSGGAPLTADGKGIYLADNYGTLITMPTCHILGYNDTMIDTAIALYHLCDEESATIVDHGKGHMIPHDAKSSRYMINGIRELIARAETTPMV